MLTEADAVRYVADRLDQSFDRAVEMLQACQGRAVCTGVGKSGAIARKLAGILSSTGTPALFLHPAEGVHGDLGAVTAKDVVIVLSYSGESDEIANILPVLKRIGAGVIGLTRSNGSTLGQASDIVLDVTVPKEACPLGLAPTSSTTATLALGDALALAVMQARKFTREDFALFHPAGALGRRLILRARDLMRSGEEMAICNQASNLKDVMFSITRAHAGMACIVDNTGNFQGVITDGDIRRYLLANDNLNALAEAVMNRNAMTIGPDELAAEGLRLMESKRIGDIPVIENGHPVGVLALKDVTRAGIV